MKKFTLLFVFTNLLLAATMQAQIKKGSIFLGGDLGGSTQTTKRNDVEINNQKGLTISPVFGKAIKENLILGGDIGFNLYENNNGPNSSSFTTNKNNSYGAGVFIRKYKSIGKSNFSMFLQGRFGINYSNIDYNGPTINYEQIKRYTVSVTAYPGISYTVSKRLQLETGFNNLIGLNYFTEKKQVNSQFPYTDKTNGISINSSLNNISSLYLGFRVLIGK
jgi:hypothetical protein